MEIQEKPANKEIKLFQQVKKSEKKYQRSSKYIKNNEKELVCVSGEMAIWERITFGDLNNKKEEEQERVDL